MALGSEGFFSPDGLQGGRAEKGSEWSFGRPRSKVDTPPRFPLHSPEPSKAAAETLGAVCF
jgi:hypothetical protein